jgi:hypothetical protein
MTLVVSEISSLGIVMTGDSAVTRGASSESGAVKVQYSPVANVGFALWGNAGVDRRRLDHWLAEFISDRISETDCVADIGNRLADDLNKILIKSGVVWKTLRRGIHVAGYKKGIPVLFHVHTGHEDEPAHELRLYKDFPDLRLQLSDADFRQLLNSHRSFHLRNGYYPLFVPLFEASQEYANALALRFNIQFPRPSLEGRLEYYELLVRFVAGTLKASGVAPAVNDTLSSIAFNAEGLIVNRQLPLQSPAPGASYSEYFAATCSERHAAGERSG